MATPSCVNDYRHISCCNLLYKCISKILTNRIIEEIKEVVSENQSAFVPGRRISDNILLTQELMHVLLGVRLKWISRKRMTRWIGGSWASFLSASVSIIP